MKATEIEEKLEEAADPATFAALDTMRKVARLCNGAKFDATTANRPVAERVIKGDPTALLCFSEALSIPSLNINTASLLDGSRRLFEIPFNSKNKNKWMLSVIEFNDTAAVRSTKSAARLGSLSSYPQPESHSCSRIHSGDRGRT